MQDNWLTEDMDEAVRAVLNGGVILYPTDTIWGLGCDATDLAAVDRIFEIKGRPQDKPFVLLADDIQTVKRYVTKIHPRVETLLNYHERPLTVIYPYNGKGLAPQAISDKQTVAFRVASDAFCREMIARIGKPLVSTSANFSGKPFPAHFGEISDELLSEVDYVVKYRREDRTETTPSVIARFDSKGTLHFIR